jgi:hypothetical protein
MPSTPAAMQWKISRMMRQWHTERALREAEEPLRRRGLFLRFAPAYPFVAAAAVLLSLIVWWGLRDDQPDTPQFADSVPSSTQQSASGQTDDSNLTDAQQLSFARTESDLEQTQQGIEMVAYLRSLTDADGVEQ